MVEKMSVISIADHKECCCSSTTNTNDSVVYLPVAPQVVARTRFSPPTSTQSQCLMVPEALEWLEQIMKEEG